MKRNKNSSYNEYESDLYIDDSALDIEWLQQPTLMMKYTKIQAEAKRKVDRLTEELNVVKADLDKDIRSDPEEYDVIKITEAAVSAAILCQDEYKEKMEELINAQYNYRIASGAVTAVEHRKQALENLTRLLGLQYFAGPSIPRNLRFENERKNNQEKANSVVSKSMKKKKRRFKDGPYVPGRND